jgi:hypothetical protein
LPLVLGKVPGEPISPLEQASKLDDAPNSISTAIKVLGDRFKTSLWRKFAYSGDTFRSRLQGYDRN